MAYARLDVSTVAEVISPPDGISINDMFHEDFVAALLPCGPEVAPGWLHDGEDFTPPPAAPGPDLAAYAADKRWRVETGGIVVDGVAVATDRESQSLITGAHAYVQSHPQVTIKFKAATGFVDLDAPTVNLIAYAVAAHVQACFVVEADVLAAITSGDITSIQQIDDWPWPSQA